jgi:hypothetical protein
MYVLVGLEKFFSLSMEEFLVIFQYMETIESMIFSKIKSYLWVSIHNH